MVGGDNLAYSLDALIHQGRISLIGVFGWMEVTLPKDQQALFKMSRDAVAPYIAAGRLTIFDAGQKIRDGVTEIPVSGHTPGHTAYLFSSRDQSLLVWGDIVHNVAVQFPHPEVAIGFDRNKTNVVTTNRTLLALAG